MDNNTWNTQTDLISTEDRLLITTWNETTRDYPRVECLMDLFEAQVDRTPSRVALIEGTRQITYRDLDAMANRVAYRLMDIGVGPETLVGICMLRSAQMLIGLLGILKAGGAYVPLDPAYPKERLAIVLEDANVPVLLTQEKVLECLPACDEATIICLDREWGALSQKPQKRPSRRAGRRNLAYLIYTSGSTGRPKGVAIERASAVTFVQWAGDVFPADEMKGVLASTSICFDLSIFEIFVPLSYGGTVIVAENALQLPTLPAASEVSLINTVPSAIAELVRMRAIPESVRTVNLAGEPLKNALVQRVYEQRGVERVYNLYGPSEDTTYSTFTLVPKGGTQQPTIGCPIANSQSHILDSQLRPVPIGETGQLYMGGDGLARGYLNRPDVTAERFIPDPFSQQPGARLYMTGDLARYLPNGDIEFLGRIDHQVKIRGFRIELGEIEVALEQLTDVREAVIVAREDIPDDRRLVGYVVPQGGATLVPANLRAYLKRKLPEYMVPSALVLMKTLPLTPSGKVDRKALPAPDWSAVADDRVYVAPRTPAEQEIARVFGEVLHIEKVGIRDNFFDLGGHSLLATRVISRLRAVFGVELEQRIIFEAPTIETLADALRGAKQADATETIPQLRKLNREDITEIPLSYAQQGLWFMDQLTPDSAAYNIPYKADLIGPLDVDALQRTLNEIVRRHESLRTTFHLNGKNPCQRISPSLQLALPIIDLRGLSGKDRDQRIRGIVDEEARRPFDLVMGPLLRTTLLRFAPHSHILLLTLHHIIGDDWSMGVFFHEMAAIYEAFSAGRVSALPDLPIQHADFAYWQRLWMQGGVLETELDYWKRQLANAPSALDLPTDRPRPPVQTYAGGMELLTFPSELSTELKSLCQAEGVTLFMMLLAAFNVLLHKHTGQTDIVVGSPIAARNRVESEGLIGFFVNTLALRTDLAGDPTFRELMQRVRRTAIGGYSHQDTPFEALVTALHLERDPSRSPLLQVMFALQNPPPESITAGALTLRPLELHNGSSKLELSLFMRDSSEGLVAMAEYNTDLFGAETIVWTLEHFRNVLRRVVDDPDQHLSQISLLTPAEERRLLVEWNRTEASYPRGECLHELIESQVRKTPDATAVVCGNERLSYRELNRRANQLAHCLCHSGVGPEMRVAVCTSRSLEMLVSLLAILKTGAAYVPMDPAYPRERLAFMLADSQSSVLITTASLLGTLPETEARVVCLDRDTESISAQNSEDLCARLTPQQLAYLIYTSGSTGLPKAVAIEHRSAVTFVHWVRDTFSGGELAGVLASTSICFDLSVFELFATLSWGGTVILAENALHLPALPAAHEVTLINTVPSAMTELMRSNSVPSSVRTVNLAGEPLKGSLVEQIYSLPSIDRILNLYGPSEDTTYSTFTVLPRGVSRPPSIGRPIANSQVYLLDSSGRPVPQGVLGEIYIGGDGLARGYLGRPDLTAERFVPNPFGPTPGTRLYRTGDLARHLPDGSLDFLGRIDHQVKIRGYRIELGEIEAVLSRHPDVGDAVVVADESRPGQKRLVAYVVPRGERHPETRDLRRFIGQKLPEPLIPSLFVFLPALPLTPNGKIDRRALPAPDRARAESVAFVEPRTPTEETMAGIWRDVLGTDRISVNDNFFELGGHSLLATQIASRIHATFDVVVLLRTIFASPTIAGLSEHIDAARWASEPVAVGASEDREEGLL